jgi:hypothetical protein
MPAGQCPAGFFTSSTFHYGENLMSDSIVEAAVPEGDFIQLFIAIPATKFPLGKIVMTATALGRLNAVAVNDGLRRHASGDWGDLPVEDAEQNAFGLKHGERLFSAYGKGENRFWIITERDRSVTTVLLPEDY